MRKKIRWCNMKCNIRLVMVKLSNMENKNYPFRNLQLTDVVREDLVNDLQTVVKESCPYAGSTVSSVISSDAAHSQITAQHYRWVFTCDYLFITCALWMMITGAYCELNLIGGPTSRKYSKLSSRNSQILGLWLIIDKYIKNHQFLFIFLVHWKSWGINSWRN